MMAPKWSVKVDQMVFWVASAAGLAVAYLLGATPAGYLAGKLLKGIDIRQHGSGSTGETNVLRTLGKWPALVVLALDVLKGAAAVVFAGWLTARGARRARSAKPAALGNLPRWPGRVAGA
jgi:glycerol-3-phosphate acyltransferase PlsY